MEDGLAKEQSLPCRASGPTRQHPSAGSAESVTELLTRCSSHQGKAGPVADQTCQDLPRLSKMAKLLNRPRKNIGPGMAIQRCRKILRDLGIFQAAAIFSVLHMRHPFAPRPQPPGSGKYEVQNGVSTSYTMTWIPDRCAHDLHSLSTFVSPESWWKSLFRNLDRWTARMSYPIICTAGLYAPKNPTYLAQSMPAQSRWAGSGLSIALIAGLKLGSSKRKRFTSR